MTGTRGVGKILWYILLEEENDIESTGGRWRNVRGLKILSCLHLKDIEASMVGNPRRWKIRVVSKV